MGVWAPDLHNYSPYKAVAQLALFAGAIAAVAGLVYKTYPESPAVRKFFFFNVCILNL
jgi:NADH dehydrogenase (ubiquinone) 1 beta subcomplex subunit 8